MTFLRLLAGLTISAALFQAADDSADAGSARDQAATAQCRTADLRLRRGPAISPATGQNPLVFRVVNRGPTHCWLKGYPSVALVDTRGRTLPFAISHRGDQMVTGRRPTLTIVRPRGSAFFTLNKYRCDLGASRVARRARIRLPGENSLQGVTIALPQHPVLGYCRAGEGGRILAVSPIAETVAATLRSR